VVTSSSSEVSDGLRAAESTVAAWVLGVELGLGPSAYAKHKTTCKSAAGLHATCNQAVHGCYRCHTAMPSAHRACTTCKVRATNQLPTAAGQYLYIPFLPSDSTHAPWSWALPQPFSRFVLSTEDLAESSFVRHIKTARTRAQANCCIRTVGPLLVLYIIRSIAPNEELLLLQPGNLLHC
jgi:hypothetical protein